MLSTSLNVRVYTKYMDFVCYAKLDFDYVRAFGDKVFEFENTWCIFWEDYKQYVEDRFVM